MRVCRPVKSLRKTSRCTPWISSSECHPTCLMPHPVPGRDTESNATPTFDLTQLQLHYNPRKKKGATIKYGKRTFPYFGSEMMVILRVHLFVVVRRRAMLRPIACYVCL